MPRALWRRVLGVADPAGAELALTALVAARRPDAPTPAEVGELFVQYGLSGPRVRALCTAAFARAVATAVEDTHLDATELSTLRALEGALGLSDTETRAVFEAAAETPLKRHINQAYRDDALSAEEKAALTRLAEHLLVPVATLTRWAQESAQQILQRRADEVVADRRLSPEEEADLHALAARVGAVLTLDDATQAVLDRYRLLWQFENGLLPAMPVPITLQRGERCHYTTAVTWLEPRTVTRSVSYAGVSSSIRIARGVRFRLGNVVPVRHTVDRLTRIDAGPLYVTNTRLILRGASRNITVRLSSLLGFEVYANGVELQKASGRPPFVEVEGAELELLAAALSGALAGVSSPP
jgi:hypothetical protein